MFLKDRKWGLGLPKYIQMLFISTNCNLYGLSLNNTPYWYRIGPFISIMLPWLMSLLGWNTIGQDIHGVCVALSSEQKHMASCSARGSSSVSSHGQGNTISLLFTSRRDTSQGNIINIYRVICNTNVMYIIRRALFENGRNEVKFPRAWPTAFI